MPKKNNGAGSRVIAVWPGMGQVALTAGFYLMSKLHMHEADSPPTGDLFDLDSVDVKSGVVREGRVPSCHYFVGRDPEHRGSLGILIGEAQPADRRLEYCDRLLDRVAELGVRQVYTFAAMSKEMLPSDTPKVLGVATDAVGLHELKHHKIEILERGQITGLNGVFLAAAARRGIPGIGLLGEMPSFATQVPWPKASHVVVEAFARLAGIPVDVRELEEHGRAVEQQLTTALEKLAEGLKAEADSAKDEPDIALPPGEAVSHEEERVLSEDDRRRIEDLFDVARRDRSKTFELKRELDRLGAFRRYENRFLDLFRKKPE